ncbi:hypothetical protein SAMN05428952_10777 [Nitrosomonas sp. Nm132]|nr:hypothetical protein SAMN05428952_10777 [Nitrosomonas sp. Nm132]
MAPTPAPTFTSVTIFTILSASNLGQKLSHLQKLRFWASNSDVTMEKYTGNPHFTLSKKFAFIVGLSFPAGGHYWVCVSLVA